MTQLILLMIVVAMCGLIGWKRSVKLAYLAAVAMYAILKEVSKFVIVLALACASSLQRRS